MRLIDVDALMDYCNNQKGKTIDANDIARFPTAVGWISVKDRLPPNADHPGSFCPRYQVIKIGEEQPRAKLTKKIVKDARWEHAYKGTSFQRLANRYGVNKKTIENAINKVTWKCVPYMPEPPKEESDNENDRA